jgi:hypothetical protein
MMTPVTVTALRAGASRARQIRLECPNVGVCNAPCDQCDRSAKPATKTIGGEEMPAHDLRHFAGTMTAQVGNLFETMARLRHSTHKASLIYQQQVSGRDIAVADALSAVRAETLAAIDAEESSPASA